MRNLLIIIGVLFSVVVSGQPITPTLKIPKRFVEYYNPKVSTQDEFLGTKSNRKLIGGSERPNNQFRKPSTPTLGSRDTTIIYNMSFTYSPQYYNGNPFNGTPKLYSAYVTPTRNDLIPMTTKPDIDWNTVKRKGVTRVWSGVGCQVLAASLYAIYYEPTKVNIRITDTKSYVKITNDNRTLYVVTGTLALLGVALEIDGGIKIGKANIGLNGLTIPIN